MKPHMKKLQRNAARSYYLLYKGQGQSEWVEMCVELELLYQRVLDERDTLAARLLMIKHYVKGGK